MPHDNYPTKKIHTAQGDVCAYCFNYHLVIDDDFDDNGGYRGTVYYCRCEKAKIEQQMKREMEAVKNQETEITNKYSHILNENKEEVTKFELKNELYESLRKHLWSIINVSDQEIIELFKGALAQYHEEFDDYDDEDWESERE